METTSKSYFSKLETKLKTIEKQEQKLEILNDLYCSDSLFNDSNYKEAIQHQIGTEQIKLDKLNTDLKVLISSNPYT